MHKITGDICGFQFWGAIVDCELGTHVERILVSKRKDEMLQSRVLYEGLVLQPRHNQPSADCLQDTKNYLRWGWLGLACYHVYKDILEASIENNCYTNTWMATMLICFMWSLSCSYFRLFHVEQEVATGPIILWLWFFLLRFSVHFLRHHTWDILRKGPCGSRALSMRHK